jgi:hypothetical protein
VTLLANATPADVEPFLQPGGKLWRDGFLARIGVVVPPDDGHNDLPFPEAALAFPPKLLRELRDWHRALGEPRVTLDPILGKGKEPTGRYRAQVTPANDTVYSVSPDVRRAFYAYDNAMRQILSAADEHDFDGSYGRFPVKAMRIAALLTSLQDVNGTKTIQLSAWYRGQAIAERWRQSLHRLVAQLRETTAPTRATKIEAQILRVLKKHGPSSINDLYRWTKIPAADLTEHLKALHSVRLVRAEVTNRTTKYRYTGPVS